LVAWIWAIGSIEILRVCGADESIKPGVERSVTPGVWIRKSHQPAKRETDSGGLPHASHAFSEE